MSDTHMPPEGGDRGASPASRYRMELEDERRRRQELEQRVQELAAENQRTRREVSERERIGRIREALQERGVKKTDLAVRIVQEDVNRTEDGEFYGVLHGERLPLDQYLGRFLSENPELLPPRIAGGSGIASREGVDLTRTGFELEDIRPGMKPDQTKQAWKEVARLMGAE